MKEGVDCDPLMSQVLMNSLLTPDQNIPTPLIIFCFTIRTTIMQTVLGLGGALELSIILTFMIQNHLCRVSSLTHKNNCPLVTHLILSFARPVSFLRLTIFMSPISSMDLMDLMSLTSGMNLKGAMNAMSLMSLIHLKLPMSLISSINPIMRLVSLISLITIASLIMVISLNLNLHLMHINNPSLIFLAPPPPSLLLLSTHPIFLTSSSLNLTLHHSSQNQITQKRMMI